jgi:hypothetical protein
VRSDRAVAVLIPVPLDRLPFASRALWAGAWARAGTQSRHVREIRKTRHHGLNNEGLTNLLDISTLLQHRETNRETFSSLS